MSVLIAARPDDAAALSEVLGELLARIEADSDIQRAEHIDPVAVVTPPADPPAALARVFIDATEPEHALLYLVDASWERILVRRVPLSEGLDEVAREQLAHIVESSVAALRAGGRIGVTREQASSELGVSSAPEPSGPVPEAAWRPRPEPPRERAPRLLDAEPARTLELALGVGWGAALFTSDRVQHGPLARLEGSLGPSSPFGAALVGQYRLPLIVEAEPIDLRLESGGVRLVGFGRVEPTPDLRLVVEAGGGLDVERVVSQGDRSTGLRVASSEARVAPILRLGAGPSLRVLGSAWLTALIGVELDLAPDDYVIRRGGTTEVVAEPLALRPGASLVLGAPPFGR